MKPKCLWCGKPLRKCQYRELAGYGEWGDYGDGHFCGLWCGYRFALVCAKDGIRVTRKERDHENQKPEAS